MKDFPVFLVVCAVLLVLLFVEAGYGETQSQEQVLGFLDELDRLSDPNFDPHNKGHFCKFYEPRLMRSPQEYKRRTVKSFQVPCARGDSIRRCHKYRLVFEPAVREETKTVLRRVRRCCKGWRGTYCNQRDEDYSINEKRQFVGSNSTTPIDEENKCWKINVTIEYGNTSVSDVSTTRNQAISVMKKIVGTAKAGLYICRDVTVKLRDVQVTRGINVIHIMGVFHLVPKVDTTKSLSSSAINCVKGAEIFMDLKTQPGRNAPKLFISHPATKVVVTFYMKGLCCADGLVESNGICVPCAAGSYHDVHIEQCIGCKQDTYQPYDGQTSCLVCPNGTIADGMNATKCTKTCSPSCQNNGLCSDGVCFCSSGYTGKACEQAVCVPSCLNGGLCAKPNQCSCSSGWTGARCSKPLCSSPCENGGTCTAPDTCTCRRGYSGVTCRTAISFCSGLPNGNYKDPNNCYGFISCSNGLTYHMDCPAGLRYNYTINQCDWPANVPCDQDFVTIEARTVLSTALPRGAMNEPDLCFTWRSHVKTFDGRYFYFPGRCTYKLIHDCQDDLFSVHVFTDPLCNDLKNCRRAVNLYLGGVDIKIHLGEQDQVTVGDKNVSLPHVVNSVVIEKVSQYVITYGYNGISVLWDGTDAVYVHVSANQRNTTCGLCGNYNGFPVDDVTTYGGQQVSSIAKFGNSWRMTDVNDLCPNVREKETKSPCSLVTHGNLTQIQNICSYLRNSTFFHCHVILDPAPFIKMCEEELCKCNLTDRLDCACSAFTQYSRACARNKAPIQWRTRDICPATCPQTLEYTECGSSCPPTCQIKKRNYVCPQRCLDGCRCGNGTVHDGQRCVPVQQCPCLHNKKHFAPNSVIKRDCNNCTCANGRWVCTTRHCPGVCSASGDPHYRTFDGLQFSFMGRCQYILAKDCVNNSFTVLVDNVQCGSDGTVSCTKNVYVHINGTTITLRGGGTVLIDGIQVASFPRVAESYVIRHLSSSVTSVYSPVGLHVKWDGVTRAYVMVQPRFRGMTCGLCGTFNNNQNDDLTTKENVVEKSVTAFGNSWKVNPACNDTQPSKHPCEMQIQRKATAEKLCNRLLYAPFTRCHHTVDPSDGYIASCMFDVCGCQQGTQCLCSAIAAYVHDCARKGIVIEWMNPNVMPECSAICSIQGQVYQVCGCSCQQTCREISMNLPCQEECAEGCNCPKGKVLREDNQCVSLSHCHCYHDGRAYDPGTVIKPTNCNECLCKDGRFVCKNRTCQVCPLGQKWVSCGAQCVKTCDNFHLPCLETKCREGCVCPEGTVLHGQRCVNSSQCLCHHGGHSYRPGKQIKVDCNTCSCQGTQWSCTNHVCPGTCSVYGELNYITFDGRRFTFSGACEYLLAQDSCNATSTGTFQIQAQNVPCGSSGLTCTKKVTITINNTLIVLEREKTPVVSSLPGAAGSSFTAGFQISERHFFTVLEIDIGLTVTWDRGTRLYITLDPKFKGQTCGLCGNFNDDRNDDFMTPQMLPETLANDFGDSWKVESSCPDAVVPKNPCATNKHRAPWAHKMCSVIRRDVFKPCHEVVDPDPWYDACYRDACACDSGGDCECLCTAIASYGHECCKHGVPIKWRTQELCPIQCPREGKHCFEYTACETACPKTCDNLCEVTPASCPVRFEGCSCPNGTVLHDGKCIESGSCPCHVGGVDYKPGSIIVKDCQRCTCESGCLSCTGPKCSTSGTIATFTPETVVATSKVQGTTTPTPARSPITSRTNTRVPGTTTVSRLPGTTTKSILPGTTSFKSPTTASPTPKSSGATIFFKSTETTTTATSKGPNTSTIRSPKSTLKTKQKPESTTTMYKTAETTTTTTTTTSKSPETRIATSKAPRTTATKISSKPLGTKTTTSRSPPPTNSMSPGSTTTKSIPKTTTTTEPSETTTTTKSLGASTTKSLGATTTKSPETTKTTTKSQETTTATTTEPPEATKSTTKSQETTAATTTKLPETTTSAIRSPKTTTTTAITTKSPETTTTKSTPEQTTESPETTKTTTESQETTTTTTNVLEITTSALKSPETTTTTTKSPETTTTATTTKLPETTTTAIKLPKPTTTTATKSPETTSTTTTTKSPETTSTTTTTKSPETTTITTTKLPETTTSAIKSPKTTTTTTTTKSPETTTTKSPEITTKTTKSPETTTKTTKSPETTTKTTKSPETTTTTTTKSPETTTTTKLPEITTTTSKSQETTTTTTKSPEKITTTTTTTKSPKTTTATTTTKSPEITTTTTKSPETTTTTTKSPETTTTTTTKSPKTTTTTTKSPEITTTTTKSPEITTTTKSPETTTKTTKSPETTTTTTTKSPETTTTTTKLPEITTTTSKSQETTTTTTKSPEKITTTTTTTKSPKTTTATTTTKSPEITTTTTKSPETTTTTTKSPETTTTTTTKSPKTTTTTKSPEITTTTTKSPEITTTTKSPEITTTTTKSPEAATTTTTKSPKTTTTTTKSPEITTTTTTKSPETTTTTTKSPEITTTTKSPETTTTTTKSPEITTTTTTKSPEITTTTTKSPETTTTKSPETTTTTTTKSPKTTTTTTTKSLEITTTTTKSPETTTTTATKSPDTATSATKSPKTTATTTQSLETTTAATTTKSPEITTTTTKSPETTTATKNTKSPKTTTTSKSPETTTATTTTKSPEITTTTTTTKSPETTTATTTTKSPETTTATTTTKSPETATATTTTKSPETATSAIRSPKTTTTITTKSPETATTTTATTTESTETTTTSSTKLPEITSTKLPETTTTSPETTPSAIKSPKTTTTTTTKSPETTTSAIKSPETTTTTTTTTTKSPETTTATTTKPPETTMSAIKSPETTTIAPTSSPGATTAETTVKKSKATVFPTTPLCPQNRVYTPCKSSCDETCHYMNNTCTPPPSGGCNSGCKCPDGTVFNGTYCVRPADCICYSNGKYYDPGATWNNTCERCWCWNNNVICRAIRCPPLVHCPSDNFIALILPGECCQTCVEKTVTTCSPPDYRCNDGRCITKHWLCDGQEDCRAGEDERNCTSVSPCFQPLGLSDRSKPDNFFTASSSVDVYYRPGEGRLNNSHVIGRGSGAWCSGLQDKAPYLQVYLGSLRKVTAVSTQGHPVLHKWVTLFRLSYSPNGVTWIKTKGSFQANTNHSTIVTNKLPQPIIAQYVRVYAEQWHIGVCLRVEFYGCTVGASVPILPTTPTECTDFRCDNGQCISQSLLCDGDDDCGDESDEIFCNSTCKEFRCNNGSRCISFKSLCDGRQDCLNGEDEDNCPTSPNVTGPHVSTNAVMTTKTSMNISSTYETTKMTSLKSETTTNIYTTGSATTRMTTKMMSPKSETQTLPTQITIKLSSPTSAPTTSGTTVAGNTSNVCRDECTCFMNCAGNIICPFSGLCSNCTCSNGTLMRANRCVVPMPSPCVPGCNHKGQTFQVGTTIQDGPCGTCMCQRKPNTLDQSQMFCHRTCYQTSTISTGMSRTTPKITRQTTISFTKETTTTSKAKLSTTTTAQKQESTTTTRITRPTTSTSRQESTASSKKISGPSTASTKESTRAKITTPITFSTGYKESTPPTTAQIKQTSATSTKESIASPKIQNPTTTKPTKESTKSKTTSPKTFPPGYKETTPTNLGQIKLSSTTSTKGSSATSKAKFSTAAPKQESTTTTNTQGARPTTPTSKQKSTSASKTMSRASKTAATTKLTLTSLITFPPGNKETTPTNSAQMKLTSTTSTNESTATSKISRPPSTKSAQTLAASTKASITSTTATLEASTESKITSPTTMTTAEESTTPNTTSTTAVISTKESTSVSNRTLTQAYGSTAPTNPAKLQQTSTTSAQWSTATSKTSLPPWTKSIQKSTTTSRKASLASSTSTNKSTTTTSKVTSPTTTTFTQRVTTSAAGPSGCVWSNCSCTKTCTDLAEPEIERCNEETCKPGWACQPGLVLLNNKVVSPVLECPCYHNETFYKIGQKFENGTCSSCMCLGDSVICTQTCNIKACQDGEELLNEPGKCCFCRKKSTAMISTTTETILNGGVATENSTIVYTNVQTTTSILTFWETMTPKTTASAAKQTGSAPETSTAYINKSSQPTVTSSPNISKPASIASPEPTTEVQIERCNVQTENTNIVDKSGCSNILPINQTSCKGSCSSSAVANVTSPWIHVDCFCCKPKNLRAMSVPMRCPDGGVKVLNYLIITKCGCEACESHGYETKLRLLVGTMFGNVTKETDDEIVH